MRKGIKNAVSQNLRYVLLIGEDELSSYEKSRVVVKDLVKRTQKEMDIHDFINLVRCYVCFYQYESIFGIPNIGPISYAARKAMSSAVTPIVGYQEITGKCTLPEKIVSKKENEIWLIRAPKDVLKRYLFAIM